MTFLTLVTILRYLETLCNTSIPSHAHPFEAGAHAHPGRSSWRLYQRQSGYPSMRPGCGCSLEREEGVLAKPLRTLASNGVVACASGSQADLPPASAPYSVPAREDGPRPATRPTLPPAQQKSHAGRSQMDANDPALAQPAAGGAAASTPGGHPPSCGQLHGHGGGAGG